MEITRRGLVVPVRADPTGLTGPTRDQTRGPHWRRTSRGFFVPATVDAGSAGQRIVEAAACLPPDAAVTGWAALNWLRMGWFEGRDAQGRPVPVDIVSGSPHAIAPRPGVRISERRVATDHLIRIDGLLVTIPEFSTWFATTTADSLDAGVVVLDMVASQDLVSLDELAAYSVGAGKGRKGASRFARALAHADENVWSPQETVMRLAWHRAMGRSPLCNVPVFDLDGHHLLTPDLLDPELGVAGEYDGLLHLADGRRRRDLQREETYRENGIEKVTMMTQDRRDQSEFIARLRAAHGRANATTGPRSWTLEQPAWWTDTSTVAARRALDAAEREIWLRRGAS